MTHLWSHYHTKLGVFGTGCRPVVKLRFIATNRYAVCGRKGAGLEYRERRRLPATLRDAVDRDRVAFAYAWIDRDGRWRLEGIAPQQSW